MWLCVLALIVLLWGIWCLGSVQENNPKVKGEFIKTLNIGVIESLSGPAAFYGEQNKRGVEAARLVLEKNNQELGLELWHEDSSYTAAGGLSAYQKLRTEHSIDAVLTHASPVALPLQSVIAKDGLLQVATSASADSYS